MRRSREAERRRMVERQIAARGIDDPRVLEAFRTVPRHVFVPRAFRALSYRDQALPLGSGQTVSQPYIVAAMTAALDVQAGDRVLEVGTGSGYQAAILARLAARVYSIERKEGLARDAEDRLRDLGITNVVLQVGDGSLGWPEEAPFDAIVVTAAAPNVPSALLEQLSERGGRLVVPSGERDLQDLLLVKKDGARLSRTRLMGCRFVPLVGDGGWAHEG